MKVIIGPPPLFDEIVAVFPMARHAGVIFTFGDTVFNPSDVEIPAQLMCHESVHAQRQGTKQGEILTWWRRYLVDPQFRVEEELLAHRAEYRAFKGMVRDREKVAQTLEQIAARLSGPLYGGVMTHAQARRLIVVDVDRKQVDRMRRAQGATA